MQHLSNLDASFLHFETPETPMHVGSLALLDLPPGYQGDFYEAFKAMIGTRMHLAKALTRKLVTMPFELAEPVWVEDDDIDLNYHVRSLTLRRPGTLRQLHELVGRLHSSLLDRSRPLWEMYVIEGLESGQIAFYNKMHHSGIDGKAGTELAKVIYDVSADIRKVPPPPRHRRGSGGYRRGVTELLQAAVSNSVAQYRKLADLMPAAARALEAAGKVLATQRTGEGQRPLALGAAPKTIFNDSITNQRSLSTMSLPMDEVKELGKRAGGTINTVVMAMCSIALERFLKARSAMPSAPLIAAVPVSLRSSDNDDMNNQVTSVRVDLATDIRDLAERFKAIHNSSEAAKAVVRELKPLLAVDLPYTGSPWIMSNLATLYGRSSLAREWPPVSNVLISNVPGPQFPLYVAGARMATFYPVSIPYHGSAVNITVQSYAGSLEWGITACQRALSQDESYELMDGLKGALEDIRKLPGVAAAPVAADHPEPARVRRAPAPERPAGARRPAKRSATRSAGTRARAAGKSGTVKPAGSDVPRRSPVRKPGKARVARARAVANV